MSTSPNDLPPLKQPSLVSSFRLQYEPAQQAWVLLYPEGLIQLNDSAAEILQRCDGTRSVEAIVQDLEAKFGVKGIHTEVLSLLQEGQRRGWISG